MIGQTISHYKILEKLGEGGMGVVYKAEDTKLRRAVALKFLTPEMTRDKEAKNRFIHEAQAASALDHPNIAVVHEIDDTDDGQSFICMAYYDGKTLKELIESGPIEVEQAIRLSIQIADGLHRAHEAGIIHRDIKPANIMITSRGEVKIVDFGVAKLSTQTRGSSTTSTGGTAAYMSPEQAQGIDVDARSDLFSLGVVMYEMVTGKRPFLGEHEAALVYTIVNMDPAPPSSVKTGISREIESIILKLLDKNLTRRYQTAAELRRDLKHLAGLTDSTRKFVVPSKIIFDKRWVGPAALLVLLGSIFVFPLTRRIINEWFGRGRVVAVLPLANINADSTNQALFDGLTEIVSSKLTTLRSLEKSFSVISSTEVRSRKIVTPDEAKRILGATEAITGSILLDKNSMRIIINLVDTRTLLQTDSKSFFYSLQSLADFQDSVAVELATMLELKPEGKALQAALAGKTNSSNAFDFYTEARGYLLNYQRLANIDYAIQLFQRAIKEDSSFALAHAGLGEAYWRKYDATKDKQWIDWAVVIIEKAIKIDDKPAPVHFTMGLVQRGRGNYELASKELRRAVEIDNTYSDAYRELAFIYYLQANYLLAEETHLKSIKIHPNLWSGYSDLGAFYYRQKRYSDAATQFKRVVEIAPDNSRGYSGLGAAYSDLQRPVEAEEMLKRAIQLDTSNSAAFSNLATVYFRQGRYSEQAQTYEKSVALNKLDYRVWGNLASAYYWSGQRDKAGEKFERAALLAEEQLKINPRDATVLSLLATYHSMLGKKSSATADISQALTIAPDNLEVLSRSIDVYEQLGQRDAAMKQLEAALKKGLPVQDLERSSTLKELRSDPRYQILIEKLGKKP